MGTVMVVGSYVTGFTMRAQRLPVGGETVLADAFDHGPGGKGSNQAIQVARVGARARLLAAVGADTFGDDALALWAAEGVDATTVLRGGEHPTGAAMILLETDGENRIIVFPGANERLDAAAVEAVDRQDATVMLTQLEIPGQAAAAALRVGRAAGLTTILNPAPVRPLPDAVLADADIVTPNESEARVLAGLDPASDVDEVELCAQLRARGVGTVVMTLGARGALIAGEDEPVRVPAPSVDVVDTTGAGDAFAGTLAATLADGGSLRDGVERAVVAGALACTKLGVIPGLATGAQIDALQAGGRS
jgi:ribokinase